MAKRIFQNYTTVTDKETKKVKDLVSDMKLKDLATETDKIVAIENYIKSNFATREDIDGENANNLENVIKTKLASQAGITRLYSAILKILGLNTNLYWPLTGKNIPLKKTLRTGTTVKTQYYIFLQ
ncbi:MAG: hypothetical protein WDN26_23600 [Chitinophagaceae bacterium]